MTSPAIDVFLALYVFACGASVGSFANVVAYRWPLGMSLTRPGSRCVCCQTPIRWHDNVPVLGWLALRGRCRHCGQHIAARYPLVEALFGLVFLALGGALVWAVSRQSGEMPGGETLRGEALLEYLLRSRMQATLVAASIMSLAGWYLTAALVRWDARPLPWRLGAAALVTAWCAMLLFPVLAVWPRAGWHVEYHGVATRGQVLAQGLTGTVVGLAVGWLLARARPPASIWRDALAGAGSSLALVGTCWGPTGVWRVALPVAGCIALATWLARWQPVWGRISVHGWLVVALFVAVANGQVPAQGAPDPLPHWSDALWPVLACVAASRLAYWRS